jgi:hypothetical protein
MPRPKKITEEVRLSVVLSKQQADRVKLMAIRMSSQEGRQITVSEAVRMAIETVYPIPKQLDLFGE